MSEHSEHYHDADRNKPLPGAPMSSKEEVLQTLLDAARGEITALAEANKLLAAQVADAHAVRDATSSLSDDDITEIARVAVAEGRLSWLGFDQDANGEYRIPLLSKGHFQLVRAVLAAAKVSARAADAPSEPSDIIALIEKAQKISPSMATRCYELTPLQVAWIIGKSRAADALDSQPTEPATRNIRAAAFDEALAVAKEKSKFFADHSRHELAAAVDQVFDHIQRRKLSSSQPTDGEVRNG